MRSGPEFGTGIGLGEGNTPLVRSRWIGPRPMCQLHLGWPASKSALASAPYQQLLAADKEMKAFADMFSSCWILPAIPSFAAIDTLRGAMMTKIYKRQDSIKNALQEAETMGQRLLDEDLARATRT